MTIRTASFALRILGAMAMLGMTAACSSSPSDAMANYQYPASSMSSTGLWSASNAPASNTYYSDAQNF